MKKILIVLGIAGLVGAVLLVVALVGEAGAWLTRGESPPPAASAPSPSLRTDRSGDPLPENAVARLGTTRFRTSGGWVKGIGFLADGSHLVPADAWQRALMWQWLCFEQYNLEPNVGTARLWLTLLRQTPTEVGERLVAKQAGGRAALAVLEQGLAGRRFLVGDAYSLADIGLYAYTHVAAEAGLPLEDYPAIRTWLARVASRPRFAPITAA